ncbi:MAG: cyclic-di-AMP receptor [Thermaerobacter sp.]|nr:cyclic-di-AMP receptor [Thermaerobacter sp.]
MAQEAEEKKCILAVVPEARVQRVEARLRHQDRRFTRLTAQGGFMRRGTTVLLLVTPPEEVDEIVGEIRDAAGSAERPAPHEAEVGTVVFVLPLTLDLRF